MKEEENIAFVIHGDTGGLLDKETTAKYNDKLTEILKEAYSILSKELNYSNVGVVLMQWKSDNHDRKLYIL